MVKKHNNVSSKGRSTSGRKKENRFKQAYDVKWGIVLVVVLVLVVFNVLGVRSLVTEYIWNRLRPTPTSTPSQKINISPATGLDTDQTSYVKQAVEQLAEKLNLKKEEIEVISVKQKEWGDSSLGCPQKGKLYIQSITSGYEIELLAKGKKYIYHGGLNRVVSC